jgi:hypothetical protein
MTPRTKEELLKIDPSQSLADLLRHNLKPSASDFDLTSSAPVIDYIHPRILKNVLNYHKNSLSELDKLSVDEWKILTFSTKEEANIKFPATPIALGYPYVVEKALRESRDILIDFSPLGIAYLTKKDISFLEESGFHQVLMYPWLNYALSPELWGTQGKWSRFHAKLLEIFTKANLLKGDSYPGYYNLIKDAQKLESFGFRGSSSQDDYTLTLSWTFPLSALKRLEEIVLQEF